MHITEKFIFSCRLVAHRHRDHLGAAHEVIEVILPVRTYHHVGSSQTVGHANFRSRRVLLSFKDTAVICPVAEIIHRSGPADVIAQAEVDAVKKVMGTVDIYSAVHNMRLGIGYIFPAGKIGVESLFFHTFSPFLRIIAMN